MSRFTILLMIAAIIAALMAITVRNRLSQTPETAVSEAAPVVTSKRVVVARRDIMLGSFVQASDLDWRDAPEGANPDSLMHEGQAKLEDFGGAVARRAFKAGDVVPIGTLMKSGDGGFMSAVLEPGMRAVSIAVNAISGNAGFITPGDRIDLIVTHRVRVMAGRDSGGEESVVSETFVRDVRVLAVDQMLDNPENKAILAKTVTVEVDQRQAEQIAIASEMGKITMALRSIGGHSAANDNEPSGTSSVMGDRGKRGGFSSRVHVIRGDQTENIEFERGE